MKKPTKNDAPKNINNREILMKEDAFIVSKTGTKGIIHTERLWAIPR